MTDNLDVVIDNEDIPYVYIFVRRDIPIAHAIVQACHACFELGIKLTDEHKPKKTSHMVLLKVKNERELMTIVETLELNDIHHTMFFEPDNNLGYTAIATQPIYGEKRMLFRKYKLWYEGTVPSLIFKITK